MADCSYRVPNKDASGDNTYGSVICDQPFIDWAWSAFRFESDYWQDGWGFDDCCNTDKPLARTFNALWLLTYSAQDWQNDSYNGNALHWARRYVTDNIGGFGLRAECGPGGKNATTFGAGCTQYRETVKYDCTNYRDDGYNACDRWDADCCDWIPCSWACKIVSWFCVAWYWVSALVCTAWGYVASWVCTIGNEISNAVGGTKHISLWNTEYFYTLTVPARASCLLHECRHIGGKAHNASFPSWTNRIPGSDGADTSWSYEGAWMYDALYLWWFYDSGVRTTPAIRGLAKDAANDIILNCFTTLPGFTVL
jgi:hypothetical protein